MSGSGQRFSRLAVSQKPLGSFWSLQILKSHIHLLTGTPREEVPASALQAILMPEIENPLALA